MMVLVLHQKWATHYHTHPYPSKVVLYRNMHLLVQCHFVTEIKNAEVVINHNLFGKTLKISLQLFVTNLHKSIR